MKFLVQGILVLLSLGVSYVITGYLLYVNNAPTIIWCLWSTNFFIHLLVHSWMARTRKEEIKVQAALIIKEVLEEEEGGKK